jgi:hypothetical protein
MNRTITVVGIVALCSLGVAYRLKRVHVRRAEEVAQAARAEHQAALADSGQIARESKAYWDARQARAQLENDELQLSNDRLGYDIAHLEGRPISRSRIERDEAIIQNDERIMRLIDPDAPVLTPRQEDARIDAHNRKFPRDQIAPTSGLTKEAEDFQSRMRAIVQDGN